MLPTTVFGMFYPTFTENPLWAQAVKEMASWPEQEMIKCIKGTRVAGLGKKKSKLLIAKNLTVVPRNFHLFCYKRLLPEDFMLSSRNSRYFSSMHERLPLFSFPPPQQERLKERNTDSYLPRRLRRWNSTQPGHVLYPVSSCFQQALANTSLDGKYSSILRFEVSFKEICLQIEGGSSSQRTEDQPEMDSCVSFVTTLQTSLSFPA